MDFDALLASVTGAGGAKAKAADAWALLWAQLVQLPRLAGYGEHWKLTAAEAKQLGSATDALAASLPKRRRDAIAKALERTVPGAVFAGTVAAVLGPRAMLTYQDMQAKAAARAERDRLRRGMATGAEGSGARSGSVGTPAGRGSGAAGSDGGAVGGSGPAPASGVGYDPPDATREDTWPV